MCSAFFHSLPSHIGFKSLDILHLLHRVFLVACRRPSFLPPPFHLLFVTQIERPPYRDWLLIWRCKGLGQDGTLYTEKADWWTLRSGVWKDSQQHLQVVFLFRFPFMFLLIISSFDLACELALFLLLRASLVEVLLSCPADLDHFEEILCCGGCCGFEAAVRA
jgi:hypothetical protein